MNWREKMNILYISNRLWHWRSDDRFGRQILNPVSRLPTVDFSAYSHFETKFIYH